MHDIHETTLELFIYAGFAESFPFILLSCSWRLWLAMSCIHQHRFRGGIVLFSCRTSGWLFTIILVVPF